TRAGTTLCETTDRPLLVVALNDSSCPWSTPFACQFCPQFLAIGIHLVFDPFTDIATTSPAPPTLLTSTRLKYVLPVIVNLIPPFLLQATLRYLIGTMPALYCAMWRNIGSERSKCSNGGLHHPPLLFASA
ncbi:hypothetical protein LINPERHAP1_LOCUS9631, partial [Linum perenne]